MTIKEAIKEGTNHIVCSDGTEFDVKPATDGGYVIHHIEKRGKPVAKNRMRMESNDAETWVKRKHGGIISVAPGKYEQYIPEPDPEARFGDLTEEEDLGDYAFEEDPDDISPEPEEDLPQEDQLDLSKPSETFNIIEEQEEEIEPEFEEEPQMEQMPVQNNKMSMMHQPEIPAEMQMQDMGQYKSSIIYEDMIMNGDINTQGSVEVYGSISGNIKAAGSVIIQGYVEGDITAGDIYLAGDHGEIIGSSVSGNRMQIDNGCTIIGDVKAGEMVIEGAIMGNIDVAGSIYIKSTAIIKGDIISKSVVIEEGAAVEGRCEQRYAENNPTSYFDSYVIKLTREPLNPEKYKQAYPETKEYDNKVDNFGGNMTYHQMLEK